VSGGSTDAVLFLFNYLFLFLFKPNPPAVTAAVRGSDRDRAGQ